MPESKMTSGASHPASACGPARVLNLPSCNGMLDVEDEQNQHAVHTWLLRALAAHVRPGKTIFVNASFTFRHAQRYPCYFSLREHAEASPDVTYLAVSFQASLFIPRSAEKGPGPLNIKWVVMEPTAGGRSRMPLLHAPHVVTGYKWPATQTVPWGQRKLLFFAGHIARAGGNTKTGWVRQTLLEYLANETRVTVNAQDIGPLSSSRLKIDQYVLAAHAHRFCVVSPGDTPSTRKVAETIVLAARGACLPLVFEKTFLPYADELNYTRAITLARVPDSQQATQNLLAKLERVSEQEAQIRMKAAKGMRRAFLMPQAARFALKKFGVISSQHDDCFGNITRPTIVSGYGSH